MDFVQIFSLFFLFRLFFVVLYEKAFKSGWRGGDESPIGKTFSCMVKTKQGYELKSVSLLYERAGIRMSSLLC